MEQDINLFYSGGSGGFFCLHLLLLTDQCHCVLGNNVQTFEQVFQQHWNISDISSWKDSEAWPDNVATQQSKITRKVYFTCNNVHQWQRLPGKKIVLYTDIETQCALAKAKHAHWFIDRTDQQFADVYNSIKGIDWPDCNSVAEFDTLPQAIKDECVNRFYLFPQQEFKSSTLVNPILNDAVYFGNDKVYADLVNEKVFEQADIVVKLQDLINSNGDVLFSQLELTSNNRCKEFVTHWLSLHTEDQLKYLLK